METYCSQTVVGVNPWVVHQNTEVFGDDADAFRPDRWLKDETGDMGKSMVPYTTNIGFILTAMLCRTVFFHLWIGGTNVPW